MPKRKTGQRKKAEKQKERQQGIRQAHLERPLAERPCNASMVRSAGYPLEVGALFTTVSSIRVSRVGRSSIVRITLTVTGLVGLVVDRLCVRYVDDAMSVAS